MQARRRSPPDAIISANSPPKDGTRQEGFGRTLSLYATKGQRGPATSPVDIWIIVASRSTCIPQPGLWNSFNILLDAFLPGDFVLDPCCGSGSTLVAARIAKRTGLGIEMDSTFYTTAMSNVYAEDTDDATTVSVASLA